VSMLSPACLGTGVPPGLNFIYAHLNRVIKERDLSVNFIAGPGHAGRPRKPRVRASFLRQRDGAVPPRSTVRSAKITGAPTRFATPHLAWSILGERPDAVQAIGFVLTLGGGISTSLLTAKSRRLRLSS
jgi:XFP N-terminal domain